MVLFFSEIKRRINDLPAKIFMSDDAQSYYNAFKFVFQEAENRLLCSWHVKNSWIKNWCKIQDVELREAMKKRLTSIYNELNEAAFEIQLDSFIDDLSADPLKKPSPIISFVITQADEENGLHVIGKDYM